MSNLNDIFFTPAANQELTYDQVLEDVQRYFAENHASTIAEAGEGNAERATSLLKELMEHYIVKRKYALDGLSTKELCSKLYEDMAGYSFLKKWIYKPGVEEVNINAYNDIEVIESSGRSIKIPDKFSSPQHAIDVIRRMLNACGMVIDDTMPSIVGFLDKNIRISVDKTPIVDADVGVNASIRIVNQQTVSEEKLLNSGSATAEMLHFLTACIRYGVSVCIAGSTGSGKTTIMAWLLSNVPNNRRLITIEEGSREFDLVKRDAQGNILNSVVHLLTRPSENPALNINQDFLLERVLRKHPDVIGVGEMRSAAESLSAAESSRTGHTVCTTIHSNSCNSTYRRMMTLAKRKYNMDDSILMQIMVEAYPIIVFTKQLEDRSRKIMEIIEGEDYQDGRLIAHSLYKYEVEDNVTDNRGETRVVGHHKKIGLISDSLKKRLLDNGINTIVHPTLEMAVDDDYIRKNPSKGIYRKLKTDGSAPKPKRRIALTKTQQQNFLRFIAKSPTYSHWLPIMTVLLGTGMRVAECTGITKSDINLSENTISVNHNLIYRVIDGKAGFHITTPKTESGTRIIPILYPEVAEQLRLQIETIDALYPDDQLVLGGVHGFVFRNRTGSFMSAHNINRAIERISVTYNMEEMDQAELEDREPDLLPHFSVHNLRHTFCTRLCESTNDVKFIQQVMGHADFSTTMDIYTHITQENMQEKAKNISVNMKLM